MRWPRCSHRVDALLEAPGSGQDPILDGRAGAVEYDAFISYSSQADRDAARAIRTGLQELTRRWNQRRALNVFLDNAELGANPALWDSIVSAMAESRFLVLVASPAAVTSRWVDREIAHWRMTRPAESILIVVTGGDVVWDDETGDFDPARSTAVPRALFGAFDSEPRYIDVRPLTNDVSLPDLKLRNEEFRSAIAQLAEPIHGRDRRVLASEDSRRVTRRYRVAVATLVALLGLLVVTAAATAIAVSSAATARDESRRASAASRIASSREVISAARSDAPRPVDERLLGAVIANRISPTAEAYTGLLQLMREDGSVRRLLNHHVFGVHASPDGRVIASVSNSVVEIWDAARPQLLRRLRGVSEPIEVGAGNKLVGHTRQGLALIDLRTGKRTAVIPLDEQVTPAVAISPDGGVVAVAEEALPMASADSSSGNGIDCSPSSANACISPLDLARSSIKVWDVRSTPRLVRVAADQVTDLQVMALSSDGSRLAWAERDGFRGTRLAIADIASGTVVRWTSAEPSLPISPVTRLAFARSDSQLVETTATATSAVVTFDAATGRKVWASAPGESGDVLFATTPDFAYAAYVNAGSDVVDVKDVASGEVVGHVAGVRIGPDDQVGVVGASNWRPYVSFGPDRKRLFVVDEFSDLRALTPSGAAVETGKTVLMSRRATTHAVLSPAGASVAFAGLRHIEVRRIWPTESAPRGPGRIFDPQNEATWSSDNRYLAWTARHGGRIWDTRRGQLVDIGAHDQVLSFSPDGKDVVLARGGVLVVRDLASGGLRRLRAPPRGFTHVVAAAMSTDGQLVSYVSSCATPIVCRSRLVLDGPGGRKVADLKRYRLGSGPLRTLGFTHDGRRIIIADDFTVLVLGTSHLAVVARIFPASLYGNAGAISAVAQNSDSSLLALAMSARRELHLYELPTLSEVTAPLSVPGDVASIAFRRNGDLLAGATAPESLGLGQVVRWPVGRASLIRAACGVVGRRITAHERRVIGLRTSERPGSCSLGSWTLARPTAFPPSVPATQPSPGCPKVSSAHWTGSWNADDALGTNGTFDLRFTVAGDHLTGFVVLKGSASAGGDVTGTIQCNLLSIEFVNGLASLDGVVSPDGRSASGTFAARAVAINGRWTGSVAKGGP